MTSTRPQTKPVTLASGAAANIDRALELFHLGFVTPYELRDTLRKIGLPLHDDAEWDEWMVGQYGDKADEVIARSRQDRNNQPNERLIEQEDTDE